MRSQAQQNLCSFRPGTEQQYRHRCAWLAVPGLTPELPEKCLQIISKLWSNCWALPADAASLREAYTDATYFKDEAQRAFKLGILSLEERAQVGWLAGWLVGWGAGLHTARPASGIRTSIRTKSACCASACVYAEPTIHRYVEPLVHRYRAACIVCKSSWVSPSPLVRAKPRLCRSTSLKLCLTD